MAQSRKDRLETKRGNALRNQLTQQVLARKQQDADTRKFSATVVDPFEAETGRIGVRQQIPLQEMRGDQALNVQGLRGTQALQQLTQRGKQAKGLQDARLAFEGAEGAADRSLKEKGLTVKQKLANLDVASKLALTGQADPNVASNIAATGPEFDVDFEGVKQPRIPFGYTAGKYSTDVLTGEPVEESPAGFYTKEGPPSFQALGDATDLSGASDAQIQKLIDDMKKNAPLYR